MLNAFLAKALIATWTSTVLCGVLIILMPSPPQHPLISKNTWKIEGGFFPVPPPTRDEVGRDIVRSADAEYFRSWSPATLSAPGRASSAPFALPHYLSVPYAGYAGDPGIDLYVECIGSGARLSVASASAHESWTAPTLRIPSSWCGSQARVVAESNSKSSYIAVGTPFSSCFMSWMKTSVFVLVFFHAFTFSLFMVGGLWLALLIQSLIPSLRTVFPLILVGSLALLGYAQFFLYTANRQIGIAFAVISWFASVACFFRTRQRRRLTLLLAEPESKPVFMALFVVSLFYLMLLYAADNGAGVWSAASRFTPAVWSTDNQLPFITSESLFSGPKNSYLKPLGGVYQVSDRPQLMTGIILLIRPWFSLIVNIADNRWLLFDLYQVFGLVLMSAWVAPAWTFARRHSLSPTKALLVLALIASSPFVLFNSIYVWPKLLSATFAFGAYLLLVRPQSPRQFPTRSEVAVAGVIAGLAMMSHEGTFFGLLPIAFILLWKPFRLSIPSIFIGLAAFLLTVFPWMLWQRLVDPPGTRLTDYALAGTVASPDPPLPVWPSIQRAYASLGWRRVVELKLIALEELAGSNLEFPAPIATDIYGRWRSRDLLLFIPSLSVLNVGWLLVLAAVYRRLRHRDLPSDRELLVSITIAIAGLLLNCMLTFSYHVIPCLPYISLLLPIASFSVCLALQKGRWAQVAMGMHFAYIFLTWIAASLVLQNRLNAGPLLGLLGAGLATVLVIQQSAPSNASFRPLTAPTAKDNHTPTVIDYPG